jgi:hypothetical protein
LQLIRHFLVATTGSRKILTQVFGALLQEGRLAEEELRGLREDKLAAIRSYAKFLAKSDAVCRQPLGGGS